MKNINSNFNPLMKFSPSQVVTTSRPIHEISQNNSGFKTDKNSKNELISDSIFENKK